MTYEYCTKYYPGFLSIYDFESIIIISCNLDLILDLILDLNNKNIFNVIHTMRVKQYVDVLMIYDCIFDMNDVVGVAIQFPSRT
jgi:hypothetical protein